MDSIAGHRDGGGSAENTRREGNGEAGWLGSRGRFPTALNLKNREVEALATEVAAMAHETKTEAIRKALVERKARLQLVREPGHQRLLEALAAAPSIGVPATVLAEAAS
ncbi:MAG: hypothetical protein EXR79_09395 [Myxococcales bacterium]|nr:hypothetical protein [Myxococcales bacterium]